MGSGLILDSEGKKMSKSSANGVTLTEVVDDYGADIQRLHTHFMSAYEDNVKWTFDGINGIISFVNKVWKLMDIVIDGKVSDKHKYEINELIKSIQRDGPLEGIGKPEVLNGKGCYSRRIDEKNRLVYNYDTDGKTQKTLITSCYEHYKSEISSQKKNLLQGLQF